MSKIFLPVMIRDMGLKEVKAAYQQIRRAANYRLGSMQAHGLGTMGGFRFPKMSSLSESQLRAALAEASRYMRDPRHTVRGEREYIRRELESFRERGIDFVDESNFYDFTNYMEDLRGRYGSRAFDSGDALDVYNNAQRIGIDTDTLKDNFEYFVEHQITLDRMKPARGSSGVTMRALRQKIGRLER